ncbi:hypothetical protein A3734_06555 [Sulfitobacter sp. HI0054]|uniref:hypothetical protein n=1 Tax=Sulfitobacter sp. HI0054 TaxID=1822238 RepID=UPI0007C36B80|nr:hypothetical protein [Sulfitobacter sp. HI0054]KZY51017.1 hypothetical protein A3734_06555 [Sulfitobacter sp. HI0054]
MIWVAMAKALGVLIGMLAFIGAFWGWVWFCFRLSDGAKWGFALAMLPMVALFFTTLTLSFSGIIQ